MDARGDRLDSRDRHPINEEFAARLVRLLLDDEQWLMERILAFAGRQGYTPYTSTLVCAWQLSISGLSEAIISAIRATHGEALEFRPGDDYLSNPLASFAKLEAIAHRERGISLGMFLGLLKYYRESYLDLIDERLADPGDRTRARLIIHRCFDLFEIALCVEWNSTPLDRVIQELREANRTITNEKNFYLTAFESGANPAFLIDEEHRILGLNEPASRLVSSTPRQAGDSYYRHQVARVQGRDKETTEADFAADENDHLGRQLTVELPALAPVLAADPRAQESKPEVSLPCCGGIHDYSVAIRPMLDVSGKFRGSVVILTDVTDEKRMEHELRELADRDPLTGAHNRRRLEARAEAEYARAIRKHSPLSALALDLDHFKTLNDTHGHIVGDRVLTTVANVCRSIIRTYDTFARTGGEEFVILLADTNLREARELADRIRSHIEARCRHVAEARVNLTVSIGVAELDRRSGSIAEMLGAADKALYAAKEAGRNRVVTAAAIPSAKNDSAEDNAPGSGIEHTDQPEQSQLVADVVRLAHSASGIHGNSFFQSLVASMAATTGSDYVFIATLDMDTETSHTLAVSVDGEPADNFSYSLKDSPCSVVSLDNICVYPRNITEMFPKDELLVEMGIEGYVGVPLIDSNGKVVGLIVALHKQPIENQEQILTLFDIATTLIATELERTTTEHKIARLIGFDQLTGLASKTSLLERLREPGRKSLLIAAVDNISTINNAYGIPEGDKVLKAAARVISESFGADFCASLGPSKFALIYDTPIDLQARAADISAHFLENPVSTDELSVYLALSFGAASGENDLLRLANSTLNDARKTGSLSSINVIELGHAPDFSQHQQLIEVSNLVHDAVKRHLIFPRFQRIVDLVDERVHKVEALARILHKGQVLSPADFLEAANASGTLPALTREMIAKSCEIMAGNKLAFSLNISESDLADGKLMDQLLQHTEQHGIAPARVTLEMLESISSSSKTSYIQQLRSLKGAGFKLSIDDFGTEYSSFARIMDLDVDYIKLDASYVTRVDTDKKCRDIIRAIVFFCENAGIASIAEHVDTPELRDTLIDLGVNYAQGYLFSKPGAVDRQDVA